MREVGIIGGGASGMMAAIAAAGEGIRVTILKRQDSLGKKILSTGNGKCNLSNRDFHVAQAYYGRYVAFLEAIFARFGVEETVRFFLDCGMPVIEKNGYLYPRTGQASSVVRILKEQLERRQINIQYGCKVERILPGQGSLPFLVRTSRGDFSFDAVILTCGSSAGMKEEPTPGGLTLAAQLGLKTARQLPALAALRCKGRFWKELAGVRCEGSVKIEIECLHKKVRYQEKGELQLTEYGISGIPVFQLSRHVSAAMVAEQKIRASLDFLPEYDEEAVGKIYHNFCKVAVGRKAAAVLDGVFAQKLSRMLLKASGLKPEEILSKSRCDRLQKAFLLAKNFPVEILEVNPPERAQVCMGGVLLCELDENLQAKRIPDLYVAGELADVDGRCGGYNLQWAWSSGYIAGKAAARATSKWR